MNMNLTVTSGVKEIQNAPEDDDLFRLGTGFSRGLLMGARGNSGVITSQIFKGFSLGLKDKKFLNAVDFANALLSAKEVAYKAVMKPVEGTILTVVREASAALSEKATASMSIEDAMEYFVEQARISLENTPNLLPVLKEVGVVDSGGAGLVRIFEGMLLGLRGKVVERNQDVGQAPSEANESLYAGAKLSEDEEGYGYCTQFILRLGKPGEDGKKPFIEKNFKGFLAKHGKSLVTVRDEDIIKVHVHTNDPGRALHEAIEYGSFVTVKVENMRLQHTEKVMSEKELAPKIAEPEKPIGVVSVCAGAGLADVFTNLGVDAIISGGQTMNPSTQDILEAVNKVPAETVYVLPNNKNIIMAAEQVDALTPKHVIVIPSKTVPQGVTAMLGFNPDGSVEENTDALTEALGTVDTMQITYAARNSDFDGYDIHEGDYLALYGSQLFGTSRDIKVLLKSLAEKVRDDGKEYVTIYYGEDVKEKHAQKAADIFADICPNADVNLLSGGQPVYYYLISAE